MPDRTGSDGGIVKTLVFMTSLCIGTLATGAFAANVVIKSNVTETIEASDNYFLNNSPLGATVKSTTAGTLNVLAQANTTNFLLNAYYSYYKYFGPGAAEQTLTWGTPANVNLGVDHTEQLTKYFANVLWNRSDATVTQLAQTGSATARGFIDTHAVNGGLVHDLNRLDQLSLTASASSVSFTDQTQFPFVDFSATARWNRIISPTTTWINSVFFDWFSEDNPAQSQRLFWRLTTGLNSKLSPRLTLAGNVGWVFVNSWQAGTALIPIPPVPPILVGATPFVPLVGTGNSVVADISLTYQLLKTTAVSLTAAQVVAPLFNGQIQKSNTIGLSLTHDINPLSSLLFFANFTFLPAAPANGIFGGQSGSSEFFSASANYSYRLTRDWRTNLSYIYRERNDDTGTARSSTVLLSLSRDFNLLGNPSPINAAEAERAKARAQQTLGYVFPGFQ